jgi:hypothetical protein
MDESRFFLFTIHYLLLTRISNLVVRPLVLVEPQLILIGAILTGAALFRFQADAPARGYHLPAHLAFDGSAERHIGEIGLFDLLLFDLIIGDAQAFGHIGTRAPDHLFFTCAHRL